MKRNAWIRLCLIALSLVMAVSMFACGNKNNDETTTAAPGTPTTEAPSTEPTEASTTETTEATQAPTSETTQAPTSETAEAPTSETTQAPTTETTEAPTTETTEAPTTETTEAPTTETTEAPTTETTEAPTTETTEAPTTETTEAPTTETTEAPTTEAPVEGDFLEFWDADDLVYDISAPKYYVESTKDGVIFENTFNEDAFITFFTGRTGDNLTATGKYLFMKYRAPEQDIRVQIFTATDADKPTGNRTYNMDPSNFIVNDNEWHLLILDLSTVISMSAAEDGQYYLQHFRLDIEGSEYVYLELAYIGITDEITDIMEYAMKTETEENLLAICPHIDELMEDGVYVDEDSHTILCALCGYTSFEDHTYDSNAVWNAEAGRYEAPCTVCHDAVEVRGWQWSRDYSDYAEGHRFAANGGGSSHSVQNGALVMNVNGNLHTIYGGTGSWGGVSVGIGAGKLGRYYVFKYRVTEALNDAETVKIALRVSGKSKEIDLNADGEWHVMIVDLTELGLSATDGLVESTGDHWFINYFDANLITYEVAFEACADSFDRITLDQDVCPHPDDARNFQYIDSDTHGIVCGVCGKVADAAAHVATHGVWDETLGYYATACAQCGEVFSDEDFGCTVGGEAEELFTNLHQWNLNRTVEDSFVKYTKTKSEVFCATYFNINPNGVATGKYMVIKYRVNSEKAELFTIKYTSSGSMAHINVENDGEWHVAVVELGADFTDGDVRLLLYHEGGSNKGWEEGDSLDIDWVYMYEELPEAYQPAE